MSIKKKFATAVATASLLAGLFGSAFVPSALAAGQSGSAGVPKANRTTVSDNGSLMAVGTSTSSFWFYAEDNSAEAGEAADDDASIGFTIKNVANAGITKLESLKAVSSNSAIVVAWGYAEETVLGTPGSDDAGYAQPMDYDDDGGFESVNWDCADIDKDGADYYSTTSTVTYVADNENFGTGEYNLCIAAADDATGGTSTITVTANGVVVKTITVTAIGHLATLDLSIQGGYQYVAEENAEITDWLKIVAKDNAGNVINAATGAAAAGNDLDASGEFDYNISEPSTSNPNNKQDDEIDFFVTDSSSAGSDGALNDFNLAEDTCNTESFVGEGDGDAGFSFALKLQGTNEAGTVISSNAITITCTGNSDYAKITALVPEATTGAPKYDDGVLGDGDVNIVATVTDGAGRPLGDGAAAFAAYADFSATTTTAGFLNWNDSDTIAAVGGKVDMGVLDISGSTLAERTYSYTVNLQVINFGEVTDEDCDSTSTVVSGDDILVDDTDCTSKSYSFTYKVTDAEAFTPSITVFRNKAKTTARIVMNFGEDEANLEQTIVVEFANGSVTEYYRTANNDGVVSFRLSLRNKTVEVYGDGGSGLTAVKTISYR